MRKLLAGLALCALAGPALAAAPDGSFAVDGPGSRSCAEFAEALDPGNETAAIAFAAWTEGFATGVNVFREDTFDITPWQTTPLLMAKLRAFCEHNPDMAYVNALGRLIAALMEGRLTESSELVQTRNEGNAIVLPAAILARVRTAVEEATGETLETPVGGFDQNFAQTIESFQRAEGLAQTGLPDQPTLNALFP